VQTGGGTAKAPIHHYRFPPQETELRGGEEVRAVGGTKLGHVEEISIGESWIDIKKRQDTVDVHPRPTLLMTISAQRLSLSEIKSEHIDDVIRQELVWAECALRGSLSRSSPALRQRLSPQKRGPYSTLNHTGYDMRSQLLHDVPTVDDQGMTK
jgi:hypothetical protein